MKVADNIRKANKGQWLLACCLIKLWNLFLCDIVDASLCVMLSTNKTSDKTREEKSFESYYTLTPSLAQKFHKMFIVNRGINQKREI